ncbi:MAG: SufD family Fe-S cluster assembly protein [Alistipes sp.]
MQEILRNGGFETFTGEVLRIAHDGVLPYAVTDARKLTVEVAAGVRAQCVLLHSAAVEAAVEVILAEGAMLSVVHVFAAEAFVEMNITQAAQSSCTLFVAELTSANSSYRFALNGDHAECTLNGLFLAADAEHCVAAVRVEHNAPDCRSYSLVKGVAGGTATGEFRGLVYVAPDAQRTDAQQQSRNILLSEQARIRTKPQLEIYADDVKCTHGATVGQMDTEALLYMRQRGLSELQARALQIEGFVSEVVGHCDHQMLREALTTAVTDKLHQL